MSPDDRDEPFSQLHEAAAAMHELFLTYQNVGFTEQQALYLVGQAVRPIAAG